MLLVHRTALRRRLQASIKHTSTTVHRNFQAQSPRLQQQQEQQKSHDPRLQDLGHIISDEYATIRDSYRTPQNPIILAHGLLGFDELHIAGRMLPGIHYWRGITEALAAKGVEVHTANVPPSGRIEARAQRLAEVIEERAQGKAVNIIAYA